MKSSAKLGEIAEKLSVDFLKQKSYEILATNWRYSHLEIDIIAKKDNFIVIVEVKARKNKYLTFEEIVSDKKQNNLINAAEKYLEKNNLENELRFDLIIVTPQNDKFSFEHIENAFYSSL